MEQHRDERIVCGDCGASFLFSAGEAAVFAERGLAAPKRCKECRLARKGRAQSPMGSASAPRGNGYRRGPVAGEGRGGPPRYTGDVNEYRSPMQDRFDPTAAYSAGPMAPRGGEAPRAGQPPHTRGEFPRVRREHRERAPLASADRAGAPPPTGPRRRVQAEMFSITCDACGTNAEVPFRPAEGREVFCQACYRARKPA